MASSIRNSNQLLTIRIDLMPGRSESRLTFTTYDGSKELLRQQVPAEVVGIRPDLSVREYRNASFHLPPDVASPIIASVRSRMDPDEPVWLQVGSSGGQLAIVPWERLFQRDLDAPLLRVPNFLADPVFLSGRLRLVLLLSSPRAKTAFPIEPYASQLVRAVQSALPQGTEIDVFADNDAYPFLASLPSSPAHRIVVHDPKLSAVFGDGGTNTAASLDGSIESPWLRWMLQALSGRSVDAVHFVCPGFFRRDQGALAVARSPAENTDREWSHMIGAGELMAFLDLAGAWAAAFTPPVDDVWAMGVRLLVDRLAWQRPGALFVHDWEPQQVHLAAAYRFLFANHDAPPPRTPSLMMYTHPKRMLRYREFASGFESVSRLGIRASEDGTIPEQLQRLTRKEGRADLANATRDESAWKRTAHLQLDRMLTRLDDPDSPGSRGTLDALERVRSILERSGS